MYATIDTLQSKGAKTELAEEFAEIMKEREQASIENLATKNDILNVNNHSTKEISNIKKELQHLETRLEGKINIAMYKSIIAMGVIVALVEKFIN